MQFSIAFKIRDSHLCTQVSYFILRGPPVAPLPDIDTDNDDFSVMSLWVSGERSKAGTVVKEPSVHEQEDGTILAICATGTSSRDSLLSWVRRLEETNPNLSKMAVLFTLTSPLGPVIPVKEEVKMSRTWYCLQNKTFQDNSIIDISRQADRDNPPLHLETLT